MSCRLFHVRPEFATPAKQSRESSGKISQQKLAAQKSRSQLLLYYKIKLDFDQGYGALVTGSYLSCLTRSTALHYNA